MMGQLNPVTWGFLEAYFAGLALRKAVALSVEPLQMMAGFGDLLDARTKQIQKIMPAFQAINLRAFYITLLPRVIMRPLKAAAKDSKSFWSICGVNQPRCRIEQCPSNPDTLLVQTTGPISRAY